MNSLEKVAGGHFYISFCPWGDMYEKWARSLGRRRPRLTRKGLAAKAKWMCGDGYNTRRFTCYSHTKQNRESCFLNNKKFLSLDANAVKCITVKENGSWSIAQRSHKASLFPISLSLSPICYSPFLPSSLGSSFLYPSLTEMPTANKLCMSQHKRKLSKR